MQNENKLTFNNVNFPVLTHSNEKWITSSDLAKLLGYSSDKSVSNIFNRHQDEFDSQKTQVINLMTVKNASYQVRLFSLSGAHLIAMLARTKVAKEFRAWILKVLEKEANIQKSNESKILTYQKKQIQKLIKTKIKLTGGTYQSIYIRLFREFNVFKTDDLLSSDFKTILQFIDEDNACLLSQVADIVEIEKGE